MYERFIPSLRTRKRTASLFRIGKRATVDWRKLSCHRAFSCDPVNLFLYHSFFRPTPSLPSTTLASHSVSSPFRLLHASHRSNHSSSFTVSVILAAALLTLLTMSSAVSCTPLPNSDNLALALSTAAKSFPCALSKAPFSGP